MPVAGETIVGGAAVYQTFHFSFEKRSLLFVVNYAVVGAQIAQFFKKQVGVVGREHRAVAEIVLFGLVVERVNLPRHENKHFVLSERKLVHADFNFAVAIYIVNKLDGLVKMFVTVTLVALVKSKSISEKFVQHIFLRVAIFFNEKTIICKAVLITAISFNEKAKTLNKKIARSCIIIMIQSC